MEKKLPISRHFFKVMMPGFLTELSVPKAFCRRLTGEKSDKAILTSRRGSWHVKIGKRSKGIICFEEGWNSFVHQHGLNLGDFLVFEHKGNMHFIVFVFESSACERDFPPMLANERKRAHSGVTRHDNVKHIKRESSLQAPASYSPGNPHFITTMNASNGDRRSPYMHIPSQFMKANELSQNSNIILRDPSGKSWLVKLKTRANSSVKSQRTSMSSGWYEFYSSNKLKEGDVCVFELSPATRSSNTAVLDVQIYPQPT